MSGATTSSAASTSGPKVSMFGAKSGFVIPKNKLSGSLVPIFRGGNKQSSSGKPSNEESTKQVQRKTKWGPDLTQDASVRNGRALAYQTRVDQITQQLKSGSLEVGNNQESPSKAQRLNDNSFCHPNKIENSELLELEMRETIGEILKLNPSYKAPPDYKPLLKEARVPIPVKQYPGYNFVSLIYGPGTDTKRRVEKETGAKIQVYGTEENTGEKVEITSSDGSEIQPPYEELHIQVSAETFEKVDAAVSLIEMVLTSVSGNLVAVSTSTSVSGDNINVLTQRRDGANPDVVPSAMNSGALKPMIGSVQATPENQFQYPSPWFQTGPPQTSMYPPSGYIHPSNPSAPIHSNPSNLPSLFGARPTLSTGLNSVPQNPSFIPPGPHQQSQGLQPPYNPHLHSFMTPGAQPSSAPPTMLSLPPFASNQAPSTGPHPSGRPFMPPQRVSNAQPGLPHDWSGGSTRWPGPNNMVQPKASLVSANASTPNITSPVFFPSRPSVNHPPGPGPVFGSGPAPPPIQSSQGVLSVASATSSSVNPALGSVHYPSPMPSTSVGPPIQSGVPGPVSASTPNFTPVRQPPMPLLKLPHPSSGDFTFQPHHSHNSASQTSRPGSHHTHNIPPSNSMVHPSAPQASGFQFIVHNQNPHQPVAQMYPRSHISNQMGEMQAPRPAIPFNGNPSVSATHRLAAYPNAISQMGPRNYSQQMPNFPPRGGQNFPVQAARPGNFMPQNQQFNSGHSFGRGSRPRAQQSYDPFLPTSGSIAPQQQGGNHAKVRKQENDAEYEDLMASVGVK